MKAWEEKGFTDETEKCDRDEKQEAMEKEWAEYEKESMWIDRNNYGDRL